MTISADYKEKWELIDYPNYKITECGKMINSQRGKLLKEVYKNGMHGFCVKGKFYTKSKIRTMARLIERAPIPF
jgi:hypothetical protein